MKNGKYTGDQLNNSFIKYVWFKDDLLHREDGSARVWVNGDKEWCINGERHRLDGPAIEFADGEKQWWINGQLHREDGPAIEWSNGGKYWYYHGEKIDYNGLPKDFERYCKLLAFK